MGGYIVQKVHNMSVATAHGRCWTPPAAAAHQTAAAGPTLSPTTGAPSSPAPSPAAGVMPHLRSRKNLLTATPAKTPRPPAPAAAEAAAIPSSTPLPPPLTSASNPAAVV
jgi:hypothetical protein